MVGHEGMTGSESVRAIALYWLRMHFALYCFILTLENVFTKG